LILVIGAPKFEVFQSKLRDIRNKDKRVTGDRYYACAGENITLIPVKSSKHLHVYIFTNFETLEDYSKALEHLRSLGFTVVEECKATSG